MNILKFFIFITFFIAFISVLDLMDNLTYGDSNFLVISDQHNLVEFSVLAQNSDPEETINNSLPTKKISKNDKKTESEKLPLDYTIYPAENSSYGVHTNYKYGFEFKFPTVWKINDDTTRFYSGDREFTYTTFDVPPRLRNSQNFSSALFESHEKSDRIKIIRNLSQINIDGQTAFSFSFSELKKETMVVTLYKNSGYVFKYSTLKENFNKDFGIMMYFFSTIKFLK